MPVSLLSLRFSALSKYQSTAEFQHRVFRVLDILIFVPQVYHTRRHTLLALHRLLNDTGAVRCIPDRGKVYGTRRDSAPEFLKCWKNIKVCDTNTIHARAPRWLYSEHAFVILLQQDHNNMSPLTRVRYTATDSNRTTKAFSQVKPACVPACIIYRTYNF